MLVVACTHSTIARSVRFGDTPAVSCAGSKRVGRTNEQVPGRISLAKPQDEQAASCALRAPGDHGREGGRCSRQHGASPGTETSQGSAGGSDGNLTRQPTHKSKTEKAVLIVGALSAHGDPE